MMIAWDSSPVVAGAVNLTEYAPRGLLKPPSYEALAIRLFVAKRWQADPVAVQRAVALRVQR